MCIDFSAPHNDEDVNKRMRRATLQDMLEHVAEDVPLRPVLNMLDIPAPRIAGALPTQ